MARRRFACVLTALLLAGCSGLQLAYNQADVLLSWRADRKSTRLNSSH